MSKMKLILSVILTFLSLSIMGNNKTSKFDYSSKWSEIDRLMDNPLLKDAQKKVDEIRVTAKKENDELNQLRCAIYDYAIDLGCEYNITADISNTPRNANREEGEDIIINHYKKASELLQSFKSPGEKAYTELFMVKMVMNLIDVTDKGPGAISATVDDPAKKITADDLREMSFENLRGVIRTHVENIIKNKETLLTIPSEKYNPLLVPNSKIASLLKSSKRIKSFSATNDVKNLTEEKSFIDIEAFPSVFDVILPDLIDLYYNDEIVIMFVQSLYCPIQSVKKDLLKTGYLNSIYADVIKYHISHNNYSAALVSELTRLEYIEDSDEYEKKISSNTKINALNDIIKQYEGKTPYIVKAVEKKHNIMCECIDNIINGYEHKNLDKSIIETYPKIIVEETDKYKKLYPEYPGIENLEKNVEWLKAYNVIQLSGPESNIAKGKDVKIKISYANIDTLYAEIYRIDASPLEIAKFSNEKEAERAKLVTKKEFKLETSNYNFNKDTTLIIGNEFDYGKYIVKFSNNKDECAKENNYTAFTISDLSILDIRSVGEKRTIYAVDCETGHPVKGVSVEKYLREGNEYQSEEKKVSDSDGKVFVSLPFSINYKHYMLHAQKDKDMYASWINIDKITPYVRNAEYRINIQTDRSTYRPGQTVEGKIILTYVSKEKEHVVESQKVKLIFKDANYEEIGKIEVVTNEFGSAPFKFAIPSDRMNGNFSIIALYNYNKKNYSEHQNIMVESYKLPVAEAHVKVKDGSSVMYGDKLEFEGEVKTFSGETVGGATVKYRIEDGIHYNESKNVIFSGEVKCNDDGKFGIVSDNVIRNEVGPQLKLYIDAVLPSGETVSTEREVTMAFDSVSAYMSVDESCPKEKKDKLNVGFSIFNAAKIESEAEVNFSISFKENAEKNITSKEVFSKTIKGNGYIKESFDLSSLSPAVYEMQLKTLSGNVIDRKELIIYDKKSSKLPAGLDTEFLILKNSKECSPKDDAKILIGSTLEDLKILVVVRDENGKLLNDEWINISNEQKEYKIAYNKYFDKNRIDRISVEFCFVRNNKVFTKSVEIKKTKVKEEQKIEVLEIVRNITPGEKQKVKMRVKPTNSNYEVAAVMVDKSLTGMLPRWNELSHYHPYYGRYSSTINYFYQHSFSFREGRYHGTDIYLPSVRFLWDNITMPTKWQHEVFSSKRMAAPMLRSMNNAEVEMADEVVVVGYGVQKKSDVTGSVASISEMPIMTNSIETDSEPAEIDTDPTPDNFADVKVRENFVETAFFYPQLTTNADGSVEFEYTAPDALTSWKMILFAHDKKVNSCITSEELQTKMPFSVKASLPRFVRKGDKCSFATTITNNDEIKTHGKSEIRKIMKGDVAIIVKDVATDKILLQQSHEFNVAAQSSVVEEWSFDVPAGVAAIEVKMVGKSGTFSDGEVHQLPVLADGTHVVKSKSMHVRGGETKDFSIPYNEKEMKDAELTVEYTDNAVWQALMALPSVKDAKYECATELISTIFVNQMAQRIANIYPEIPSVVEEWKREGAHATSPLEQNQELKNVLMQQTPWMCEAKNESEQRAKIVELYDKGRIAKANKDAISKLQKLQQSDGGIAWFADFKPSEYVTVYVAKYLVEMREYGVLPKECEKMLKSAVKYIDKALAEAYKNEIEKKWNANREWVFDVFKIRISYDKNLDNNTQKILDYYVDKAHKEIKEMTLYGKASFAIVLNMKGDEKEAKSIVESLRQSATETEELGMYWKENQDSWGRYGNAISTHAMLTKAFQKTGCDAKELSDLRFHLISKKETTQWNSTESTLAAIDALVGDGKATSDLRKKGNRTVANIKIGGTKVDAKRMAGDGYVKIHYNKESFTPELCNNIHIEQPAGQEGIGGIYIAYDAPYSEITSGKSGIEVKKKMYKVVIANDGDDDKEMLQEIKDGEKLKKGDKVKIVMTLRSDRDIDFVQVLDLRAACLEPVRKRPGMEWADGKFYYQSITDSEYSMFFDHISKGTRVFEYTLHVTQSGEYTQGITKVIPHYCPAFSANSEGGKVSVE